MVGNPDNTCPMAGWEFLLLFLHGNGDQQISRLPGYLQPSNQKKHSPDKKKKYPKCKKLRSRAHATDN